MASPKKHFTNDMWVRLVSFTNNAVARLSKVKGGEYSGDDDRLANFRRNGEQMHVYMETCWAIYYNKHHDAIMQYIRDMQDGVVRERAEPLAGRVDDMITYLILFKAMLAERGDESLQWLFKPAPQAATNAASEGPQPSKDKATGPQSFFDAFLSDILAAAKEESTESDCQNPDCPVHGKNGILETILKGGVPKVRVVLGGSALDDMPDELKALLGVQSSPESGGVLEIKDLLDRLAKRNASKTK